MTVETYDDLKQYVGSKNDFTDDLLNMGYTKGKKDGYTQALEDIFERVRGHYKFYKTMPSITFFREMLDELSKGE